MKISRHNFFSTLSSLIGAFLVTITAKAQSATIITPCRPKLQWQGQTPLCNGQCPNSECAYRAPEFPKKVLTWDEAIEYTKPGEIFWETQDLLPSRRLNRCPNCNTAFWQDPTPEVKY